MSKEGFKKAYVYKCPCGYTYDPLKGCKESNVDPGVQFESLPDQLTCPRCQRAKVHFREKGYNVRI